MENPAKKNKIPPVNIPSNRYNHIFKIVQIKIGEERYLRFGSRCFEFNEPKYLSPDDLERLGRHQSIVSAFEREINFNIEEPQIVGAGLCLILDHYFFFDKSFDYNKCVSPKHIQMISGSLDKKYSYSNILFEEYLNKIQEDIKNQ